jgi:hypothetical protein
MGFEIKISWWVEDKFQDETLGFVADAGRAKARFDQTEMRRNFPSGKNYCQKSTCDARVC